MSRARDLSKLGNINVLSADDVSSEVGIASTVPRSTLDVRGELQVGTAIKAGPAGVLTATSFDGGTSGNVTGAACTFTTGTFNGNVTIGGTLTYEDVTNIDSLGIVTARAGVNVSGGQLAVGVAYSVGAAGVATAAGFVGPLTGNVTGGVNVPSGTTSQFADDVTFTGASYDMTWDKSSNHLIFGDNAKATWGNSGVDLTLYHDSASTTDRIDSGNKLEIRANASIDLSNEDGSSTYAFFNEGGSSNIHYANSKKFETTNDGTVTTGIATATAGLEINADNKYLKIGAGGDLQMMHNGTNSLLINTTGDLVLQSDSIKLRSSSGEAFLQATLDGSVDLRYNDSLKFATTNDGTTTTGIATATGLDIADKITHTGDADTAIRFPDVNTVSVETAGVEGMRIGGSDAIVAIGTNKTSGSGARLRIGSNLLSLTQDMSDGGMTVVPRTGDTIATDQVMPLITAAGEGASPNILRAGIAVISKSGRSAMDMVFCTRYAADGTALDVTDDETMRLTSDNRVCIGATASQNMFYTGNLQVQGTNSSTSAITVKSNQNDSGGPAIVLGKSRGTSSGAVTAVNDGDELGTIYWAGADGTDVASRAAAISGIVDGSPGSNDLPGRLVFKTTADGAASETERLRIDKTGSFIWSNGAFVEKCNITAGKLSDNTNIDLQDGMVHYFTTQESTTSTPNIRVSSAQSLNDKMTAGDVVTVTLVTTAAAGGYSANVTIDGQAVTEEWVGGEAPSAGGDDGLDIYVYTIICIHASNTGDSGFKVIANKVNATN